MARYRGPVCKLSRAEGVNLMLKGKRFLLGKDSAEKRKYPPGEHGQRRTMRKLSDYGVQLREKQKAKRIYGVLERQFRRYFKEADRMRGITGTNLLQLLERRLDNVIYRLGYANTRAQARQLVRHNHVKVDGKRVNIPSYQVKIGQLVEMKDKSKELVLVQEALQTRRSMGGYPWMEWLGDGMAGKLIRMPAVEEIAIPVNEQLIVELYSK